MVLMVKMVVMMLMLMVTETPIHKRVCWRLRASEVREPTTNSQKRLETKSTHFHFFLSFYQ